MLHYAITCFINSFDQRSLSMIFYSVTWTLKEVGIFVESDRWGQEGAATKTPVETVQKFEPHTPKASLE